MPNRGLKIFCHQEVDETMPLNWICEVHFRLAVDSDILCICG